MKELPEQKWWGWGELTRQFDLDSCTNFRDYLNRHFTLPSTPVLPIPQPQDFHLPASRIGSEQQQALSRIIDEENFRSDAPTRLFHAVGKSYYDLIRLRYHQVSHFPDAVLFPQNEEQLIKILAWSAEHRVAVVPFGGGTSVVGGVEAVGGQYEAVLCLDLRGLNRVTVLDKKSLLVEAEAGILGPDLERCLQAEGCTLGHSPESFEYSTLGGWLATRSAGQFSTYYGKIEEMVESLRLVTARGVLTTPSVPASAAGPDLNPMILGSEGTLGIISRARLRLHLVPQRRDYRAYLFKDYDQGVQFVWSLLTNGGKPALLRLSDGAETELAFALAHLPHHPLLTALVNLIFHGLEWRGFSAPQRSLLLLGFDGSADEIGVQQRLTKKIRADFKTQGFGKLPAQQWYRQRYDNPYLRDRLLDLGLMIDTLETAAEWPQVLPLYRAVKEAVAMVLTKIKIAGVVTAHLSHLYRHGSSLYFIILAQPVLGSEVEQWQQIKTAASEAILAQGGTISHHHGIGLMHKLWFGKQVDSITLRTLRQLKKELDPEGILNPGKLIPNEEDSQTLTTGAAC